MASTEAGGGTGHEHPLGTEHLSSCLALSKAAGWNQNEEDWRLMLSAGRGWGLTLEDGTLAASTLVLPYGSQFAWISMVLVSPAQRRRGYASRLLGTALAYLRAQGLTPILDATPAGREVYRREGFTDRWGFRRFQRAAGAQAQPLPAGVREMRGEDWPAVLALDGPAFGASREALLRALAARLPESALVYEQAGAITGFVLGRDGREAGQIGPLVANGEAVAQVLLAAALGRGGAPVYVDLADHATTLSGWLETHEFVFQRPFTRMVHGPDPAPGDGRRVFLVAGPELG